MTLLAELKRRNVIRVAGLYVVGAWLLIQVAETLLPIFETPAWVLKSLVVLLALGFVPALVLSWIYELTPDGVRRERDIEREHSSVDRTARRLDIAVIVLLVGIGAMLGWEKLRAPEPTPAQSASAPVAETRPPASSEADAVADPARSIAVLAFDDLSPGGDQAYFADGISEELLNLLARIDGFKVAARTSSFKFKGTAADIGEIGRALNVETVLEGSVRKAGDQIRVTAQLINVADGFHIWSQSYDRQLDNIFAVQDEIAAAIVSALKLKFEVGDQTPARTTNVAAYDLYLQARQLAREPKQVELMRAIDLYQQAIALDPTFAAPHSGIAEAWAWLEDYGGVRPGDAYAQAAKHARRALELDPNSAEAWAALGFVRDRLENDSRGATEAFERALELNPSYVPAYSNFGFVLSDLGEPIRSVEVQRKAVELDPLSVFMKSVLANNLLDLAQFDEGEALMQSVLVDEPDNDFALEQIGNIQLARGQLAEATLTYARVHRLRPGDPYSAARISTIGAFLGDPELAARGLQAARERGADNRWELFALGTLAEWQQKPEQIQSLAQQPGWRGAFWRAHSALARQDWAQARAQLQDALSQRNYDPDRGVETAMIPLLIELARVEKQLGEASWRGYADSAQAFLLRLTDLGGVIVSQENALHLMAQVAALNADRDEALARLRAAIDNGFLRHWFLDNDPLFEAWRDDPEFVALVTRLRTHAAAERAKLKGVEIAL